MTQLPALLDIETILAPIPGDSPAGQDLRYSPLYDDIRRRRRAIEDKNQIQVSISQCDSEFEPLFDPGGPSREETLQAIRRDTVAALTHKSKDLQLAAWFLDASMNLDGLSGATSAVQLIREMLDRYWDTLFPLPDPEDDEPLERRVGVLDWMSGKLAAWLHEMAINEPGSGEVWSLDDYQHTVDTESHRQDLRNVPGARSRERFQQLMRRSSQEHLERLSANLVLCREEVRLLETVTDVRCVAKRVGRDGRPRQERFISFRGVIDGLHDCSRVVRKALSAAPPQSAAVVVRAEQHTDEDASAQIASPYREPTLKSNFAIAVVAGLGGANRSAPPRHRRLVRLSTSTFPDFLASVGPVIHFEGAVTLEFCAPHDFHDAAVVRRLMEASGCDQESANAQLRTNQTFARLRASWSGLEHLVVEASRCSHVVVDVWNLSGEELTRVLDRAPEFDQSLPFKRLYEEAFGTFGGDPYSVFVLDHYLTGVRADLRLLESMAATAAAAHAMVFVGVDPRFLRFDPRTPRTNDADAAAALEESFESGFRDFRYTSEAGSMIALLPGVKVSPYDFPALINPAYLAAAVAAITFREGDATAAARRLRPGSSQSSQENVWASVEDTKLDRDAAIALGLNLISAGSAFTPAWLAGLRSMTASHNSANVGRALVNGRVLAEFWQLVRYTR